jgi:hypothetical protein
MNFRSIQIRDLNSSTDSSAISSSVSISDSSPPVVSSSFSDSFSFHFSPFPTSDLPLACPATRDYYLKWGLNSSVGMWRFRFDEHLDIKNQECVKQFLCEFFNSPAVKEEIKRIFQLPPAIRSVEYSTIPTTITSMSFFDRLYDDSICSSSGFIRKSLEEFHDGLACGDELRKCLKDKEGNKFNCFSDSERAELLFRLFSHFVFGGSLCQYEDEVSPYLTITQQAYKQLAAAQINENKIQIHSCAYEIRNFHCEIVDQQVLKDYKAKSEKRGVSICPFSEEGAPLNLAILTIDNVKRIVNFYYYDQPNTW